MTFEELLEQYQGLIGLCASYSGNLEECEYWPKLVSAMENELRDFFPDHYKQAAVMLAKDLVNRVLIPDGSGPVFENGLPVSDGGVSENPDVEEQLELDLPPPATIYVKKEY